LTSPKRKRRTKAQIEADKSKEVATKRMTKISAKKNLVDVLYSAPEPEIDMLMTRIDSARIAVDKSKNVWSKNYWQIVLNKLLRQGNRG
jgi:hypothetical protein